MAKLTDEQLDRKDVIDAIRSAAALEFRIQKRRILNEVENEILSEFDKRMASGQTFRLSMPSVLESVRKRLT